MEGSREDVFTNRPPTPVQADVLDQITAAMLETDALLHRLLPHSRYRSLACTALEECSMWAKKGAVFTVEASAGATERPRSPAPTSRRRRVDLDP